ncbi:hypothetical protein [Acidianus manzaensis]|uniref:Uncharacterized protein n=1 Tax=Acidianus manzaensis TaxID=282676 RepID=A0A1W6K1J5_9CREN|nr:hypothetical protein [Acidianus manzaensis]ARM76375.1 hypothetical protein B6F84_10325 [Acidianus manzaensis]
MAQPQKTVNAQDLFKAFLEKVRHYKDISRLIKSEYKNAIFEIVPLYIGKLKESLYKGEYKADALFYITYGKRELMDGEIMIRIYGDEVRMWLLVGNLTFEVDVEKVMD